MTVSSPALRSMGALALLTTIAGCRPTRTVKLSWDAPAILPVGYRVVVDEVVVMDIRSPAVDPSCKCLTVSVAVPRGPHHLAVIAYNEFGSSAPSAVAVVK